MACVNCTKLIYDSRDFKCAALVPSNVDFSWAVNLNVPVGRFLSEVSHLKPCPLQDPSCTLEELESKASIVDEAIEKTYKELWPGREIKWTNRFREYIDARIS
jgi:hypothetical protein